ncbi:MAG: DNA-processing protein DprA [Propionibacteriaceae bacterium]|nr:DNA-processing protein DprA [Propionibacteriaceae bacterium]
MSRGLISGDLGARPPVRDDRMARMALACVTEPGDKALCDLVTAEGAEAVWASLTGERRSTRWGRRLGSVRLARVMVEMRQRRLRFVVPGDEEWPGQLDDLAHVEQGGIQGQPLGLWVQGPGHLAEWSAGSVAVVGTRTSTRYGEAVAAELGADLAASGRTVVSGGAYGIDISAHRGALAVRGRTISVLASGLDEPYPRGNSRVFQEVSTSGLLVSELPPLERPTRTRFLGRNRVIAGLAVAAVMVEAKVRSGAANTLAWAEGLSRTRMAVPGPVTSAASEGPHEQIRTEAKLVTDAAQVCAELARVGQDMLPIPLGPMRPVDQLTPVQREVFEAVPGRGGLTPEAVAGRCGHGLLTVLGALEELEAAGLVLHGPRGWRLKPGAVG